MEAIALKIILANGCHSIRWTDNQEVRLVSKPMIDARPLL